MQDAPKSLVVVGDCAPFDRALASAQEDLSRAASPARAISQEATRAAHRCMQSLLFLAVVAGREAVALALEDHCAMGAESGSFLSDFAEAAMARYAPGLRRGEPPYARPSASCLPNVAVREAWEIVDDALFGHDESPAGRACALLDHLYLCAMAEGEGWIARRRQGIYHTPPDIARDMCAQALAERLAEVDTTERPSDRPERHQAALALVDAARAGDDPPEALARAVRPELAARWLEFLDNCAVCDPALGTGQFLLAMLDVTTPLAKILRRLAREGTATPGEATEPVLKGVASLYGVDLRPEALRVCHLRLLIRAAGLGAKDRIGEVSQTLARRLAPGDSLLGVWRVGGAPRPPTSDEPPLPPFPEVFERGGFDIVIGNPPYVSFGQRGRSAARQRWDRRIRRLYPRSAEYKISLYALFFELAVRWTRPGGALCLLTPDSFLVGRYFSKVRNLLLTETALRCVTLIRDDFWRDGVVGRPVVTTATKGGQPATVRAAQACDMASIDRNVLALEIPQRNWSAMPLGRFELLFTREAYEFVAAMRRGAQPLQRHLRVTTGMRSRTRQVNVVGDTQRDARWKPGLISGRQVEPYRVRWLGHYLLVDPEKLYSGGWDAEVVERPKLLIRQTGDSLVCALDESDHYYHLNNIHAAAPYADSSICLRFLCILLNSRLMNRYYHLTSLEKGRPLAQTRIDAIERLPLRLEPAGLVKRIAGLWERMEERDARERAEDMLADLYELPTGLRGYLTEPDPYPRPID